MAGNTRILLRLYSQPVDAMGDILDRGSLLFASAAVIVVAVLTRMLSVYSAPWLPTRFYTPLLLLAVVYVPGILLLAKLTGSLRGGLGAVFQRDYAPLLTCTGMAWVATQLPVAVASRISALPVVLIVSGLAYLYFAFLMFLAVRTVLGTENRTTAVVVCLSWLPLVAAAFVWGPLGFLFRWLASPFFLFFILYYLRGEIGDLGAGLRSRQHFRRMLDAAAVNPHDGEAQYQLGLIYQERRQLTEAVQRYRNAVAIDPSTTDAHFQLGRIARQQGRLHEALEHFQTVLNQDEKHSQNEVLRELGAVYLAAGQYTDADSMLSRYVERRPYDPEGLVYYGQALDRSGRTDEAREMFGRAIEAARTAPRYRRREVAQWSRAAQKQLRALGS